MLLWAWMLLAQKAVKVGKMVNFTFFNDTLLHKPAIIVYISTDKQNYESYGNRNKNILQEP